MAITDLLPWKRSDKVPVDRSGDEESYLPTLRRDMNQLLNDFMNVPFGEWLGLTSQFVPNIDVTETDREIMVVAELPGMDEKDIDIRVDRSALVISGEKRSEAEERHGRYHCLERSYGSFHRSIPMSWDIDQDRVEASLQKGVLRIRLPKQTSSRGVIKRIKVRKT